MCELVGVMLFIIGLIFAGSDFDKFVTLGFMSSMFLIAGAIYSLAPKTKDEDNKNNEENKNSTEK